MHFIVCFIVFPVQDLSLLIYLYLFFIHIHPNCSKVRGQFVPVACTKHVAVHRSAVLPANVSEAFSEKGECGTLTRAGDNAK